MTAIGTQHGIVAAVNRLRDLDPAGTKLAKSGGKWPPLSSLANVPLDEWKAWDKFERTLSILREDHDADESDDVRPPVPPGVDLSKVQRRMFLAQNPLDALQAPPDMVPVCTADLGYRSFYTPDVIGQLRSRFGGVEAWCDCRAEGGTPYSTAEAMVVELRLDGPAWGQCETAAEFDHAYQSGARRMVGQIAGLRPDQANRIGAAEVLLAFELYRNVMPWQVPDYGGQQDGVGGNCIGVYASESEHATYTPVADYKAHGYYVHGRDSVYGVGLTPEDWRNL